MAWYWWLLLIIVTIYFYSKRNGRAGEMSGKDTSLLNPFFRSHGIEPRTVSYSAYDDQNILSNEAEKIYVGMGYKDGQSMGFWAEVKGTKIIDSSIIHPGAASYHRSDARVARYEGSLLKHKLTERSLKINSLA